MDPLPHHAHPLKPGEGNPGRRPPRPGPSDAGRDGSAFATRLTAPREALANVLLIGIGNPLRGDDGVGPRLAARARRLLPAGSGPAAVVAVRSVQQLTPELAEPLSRCGAVLFLDAWIAPAGAVPERIRLEPSGLVKGSHRLEAAGLLAISRALYGRAPEAELLRVPGHAFGHGRGLSAALRGQWPLAEALLRGWLERHA